VTLHDQPAAPKKGRGPANREHLRLGLALGLGGLVAVFAILNVDEVEVNWIVTTTSTPLIVVIVVSALLGAGIDRGLGVRSRRRKRRHDEARND
jgi:uncharacterized integral membrane protein